MNLFINSICPIYDEKYPLAHYLNLIKVSATYTAEF
jgi:hypothetical protein